MFNLRILLLVFLFLYGAQNAYGFDYSCPPVIMTKQDLNGSIAGWKAWLSPFSEGKSQATRIDFYEGHPDGGAYLKPNNGDADEDPSWTFTPHKGQEKTGLWQVCVYVDTRVTLIRELPRGLKKCKVVYNRVIQPKIDAVICS